MEVSGQLATVPSSVPTVATCGSVKIVAGTARWSARAARPAMSYAATRAWYLPTWVKSAMPVTSPIAQTFSAARIRSSTSMPLRPIVEPERLEPACVRPASGGDEQPLERRPGRRLEHRRAVRRTTTTFAPRADLDAVLAERLCRRAPPPRRRCAARRRSSPSTSVTESRRARRTGRARSRPARRRARAASTAPRASPSPRRSSSSRPRRAPGSAGSPARSPVAITSRSYGELAAADLARRPARTTVRVAADELAALGREPLDLRGVVAPARRDRASRRCRAGRVPPARRPARGATRPTSSGPRSIVFVGMHAQ